VLADLLLMLAMGRCRTAERRGKIGRRGERRALSADAPRQPVCNLLEQPDIAVGIAEGRQRAVARPLRIGSLDSALRPAVKYGADIRAMRDEIGAGRLDVVHDQEARQRRSGVEVN
jgi:hypothetical protein